MLNNNLYMLDFLFVLSIGGLAHGYNSMFKLLVLLECATLAIVIKAALVVSAVKSVFGQVLGLVLLVLAAVESILGLTLMFNLFHVSSTTSVFINNFVRA
jgi:NADH:ubiquinone oxidoreductase subunit K